MARGSSRCSRGSNSRPPTFFERVATGLPSLVLATGAAESGPADVSFHGMVAYVQIGFGGDPAQRALLGDAGALFGTLQVRRRST